MSKHIKHLFKLSASDESRVNQIFKTFDNLSDDGKTVVVLKLPLIEAGYKRKMSWSYADNTVLRLMWNRCNHDEICDALMCSYTSILSQAIVLGLAPQEGTALTGEHGAWMLGLLKGGMSPKEVADKFEIPYDFNETHVISDKGVESINEMKQNVLFGGDCE